jgi:hypothetical protein
MAGAKKSTEITINLEAGNASLPDLGKTLGPTGDSFVPLKDTPGRINGGCRGVRGADRVWQVRPKPAELLDESPPARDKPPELLDESPPVRSEKGVPHTGP